MATQDLQQHSAQIRTLLREKLGVRGKSMAAAMAKARHRLPGHVYRQGQILVAAQPLYDHPKLRQTLDCDALDRAAAGVRTHLNTIDVKDRRKGWWLGMLGGLAFNMILMVTLLIVFLKWQGLI